MQRRTEVAGLVQKGLNQYVHTAELFDRVSAEKLKATQLDPTAQKALFVYRYANGKAILVPRGGIPVGNAPFPCSV
jgi:hypothetical protein